MTDLSIIVVSYKGWERLGKCLDSLNEFNGNDFSSEVIVVDNNSGEDIIHDFEKQFPSFTFILNNINGGFAYGNNTGSKIARGEFLLILNPDTVVTEYEIGRLLKAAKSNPGYSLVSCLQVNEKGDETNAIGDFPRFMNLTGFQRSLLKLIRRRTKELPDENVIFPDWISGSAIMLRNELYKQLNGFYEGFWMYYEDVDLCKRVSDNNGKIAFFRDIRIEHNHGGSSRINTNTASITKTEVRISQHIYVSRNMSGAEKVLSQIFLVMNNLISGVVMAIIGILFFFIPKLFLRTKIFFRLIEYYARSISRQSWIGKRSILNNKAG